MEATLPLVRRGPAPARFTFSLKILAALILLLLADRLFYRPGDAGATLGIFALALLAATFCLRLEIWRRRSALAQQPPLLISAFC
jgi:hypothetical protein